MQLANDNRPVKRTDEAFDFAPISEKSGTAIKAEILRWSRSQVAPLVENNLCPNGTSHSSGKKEN